MPRPQYKYPTPLGVTYNCYIIFLSLSFLSRFSPFSQQPESLLLPVGTKGIGNAFQYPRGHTRPHGARNCRNSRSRSSPAPDPEAHISPLSCLLQIRVELPKLGSSVAVRFISDELDAHCIEIRGCPVYSFFPSLLRSIGIRANILNQVSLVQRNLK